MGVSGFLKEVLVVKNEEISSARASLSEAAVRRDAEQSPARPDFLAAMQKSTPENIGIIAEIKKASPSKGDICPDLDPFSMAEAYSKGGARAVSVLTEQRYFKGSLSDLKTAVTAAPELPVLRKDFVISAYQIFEAKKAGASSVLLITTILSGAQLKDYIHLVRELGMEPLVEITSEKEFETAYDAGGKVMDINNRNLQTLETDLTVSKRIAAIVPDDVIPVEASGISARADIENGIQAGMVNFLVGESIVRSQDPAAFIETLRLKQV